MNNAIKMVSLAAVSSFSAAALAFTATAPVQAPVRVPVAPYAGAPKAVNQNTEIAKAVDLDAVANENSCEPSKHYAAQTAGTKVSTARAEALEKKGYVSTGIATCAHDFEKMSAQAREVAYETADCAEQKDANSADDQVKVSIYGGCMLQAKKTVLGVMTGDEMKEAANAIDVADTCGYLPGARGLKKYANAR